MRAQRRQFLNLAGTWIATGFGVLLRPISALASDWNKNGFDARSVADVLKYLNAGAPAKSNSVLLKVPEIADDGSVVPVVIASRIPNTQVISVLVDNNMHPLAATFVFSSGADPGFSVQLKLRRTSPIGVVVQASGQYFRASKEVKVAIADACDAGN